jgi:hypothetical protein
MHWGDRRRNYVAEKLVVRAQAQGWDVLSCDLVARVVLVLVLESRIVNGNEDEEEDENEKGSL